MATDLSSTSRFTEVRVGWSTIGFPRSVVFQTTTDDRFTNEIFDDPKDYGDIANDSHLAILRDIYADQGGLLDADGNIITINVGNFNLSDDDVPVEDLSRYGSFNPFIPAEFDSWIDRLKADGAFIREGSYSENADTGRPRIESSIDQIPSRRRPDGVTFAYPLGDVWDVDLYGDSIQFTRTYTLDDDVTDPNAEDSVLAFLAWVESLRVAGSGSAVGDDILATTSFTGREYDLVQGSGADTIRVEVTSVGHFDDLETGVYGYVSVSFQRISTETGDIDVEAIRTLLLTATGGIPPADAQEAPEIGSTGVPQRASEIILPDNYRLGLHGKRLALRHPSMGVFPLDGAHVRAVRFEALEDITGVTNGKYMPNDGGRRWSTSGTRRPRTASCGTARSQTWCQAAAQTWCSGFTTSPTRTTAICRTWTGIPCCFSSHSSSRGRCRSH